MTSLTREEWNALVDFVKEHDPIGMPTLVYENYDDWNCRASLARVLAQRLNRHRDAIRVMDTVLAKGESLERDHRIWALRDMGVWNWIAHKDGAKAIHYLREAMKVADVTDTIELAFSVRGEVWYQYLWVLHHMGESRVAEQEAFGKLHESQVNGVAANDESYAYYANLFLGQIYGIRKQWNLAIEHLKPVVEYLADDYGDYIQKQIDDALTATSLQSTYEKLFDVTKREATFYVHSEEVEEDGTDL